MFRSVALYTVALLVAICTATAEQAQRLSSDQMARAARTDSISVPTPGELFAARGKTGKINWSAQYRGPIPMTYSNRAQIALNLGGLIADGFIDIEAKEKH